jgi:hypothetical protein
METIMDYLKHLTLWDGKAEKITENINENYSGGIRVRIKKLDEIIDRDKSKNSTLAKIKPTIKKKILFITTVVAPIYLNVTTIVNRWIDRPERNSEEFHNWSTLAVIYTEFAALSVYVSLFAINFISVFSNNLISKYLLHKSLNENCFNCLIAIILLIATPFDIWIFYKFFSIFVEEIKNFDIDGSNQTLVSNSSFSELSLDTYVYISLFHILSGIYLALLKLRNFNINYNSQSDFDNKQINHYDPDLILNIVKSLNIMNGVSLIKFISWFRYEFIDYISDIKHKIKTNTEYQGYYLSKRDKTTFKVSRFVTFLLTTSIIIFFSVIFFCLGIFSFIHRIKDISFISTIEPLDWDRYQFRSFLAFINNILSLDTGNKRTLKSIFSFLFTGEDALESISEASSQYNFKKLLVSYSIKENGLIQTIISFTQLTHKDIQMICIHENNDESIRKLKTKEEEENTEINTTKDNP